MHHVTSTILLRCLALVGLFLAAGCASDDAGTNTSTNADPVARAADAARSGNPGVTTAGNPLADMARPRGNPIKVTWEALAHERYLYENPKYGRRPLGGVDPDFKIVLVNESHPEAQQIQQGRVRGSDNAGSGVLTNAKMRDLLKGFEKVGFFQAAASTQAQERFFDDDRARGRVTIERPTGSVTLLSMRGQGLNQGTKHIPGIYSQAKQAIAFVKNQTRTLTVETIGREATPYR